MSQNYLPIHRIEKGTQAEAASVSSWEFVWIAKYSYFSNDKHGYEFVWAKQLI